MRFQPCAFCFAREWQHNLYHSVLRITHYMVKVTKSVRLPIDVAERLEEEDNQSVAVEDALRERYGL